MHDDGLSAGIEARSRELLKLGMHHTLLDALERLKRRSIVRRTESREQFRLQHRFIGIGIGTGGIATPDSCDHAA